MHVLQNQEDKSVYDTKYPKLVLGSWHGMSFGPFLRQLRQNGYWVSGRRVDRFLSILCISAHNSVFNAIDRLVFGRRVDQTVPNYPPLFIIGHWRTGTTLLHELFVRDPQFTYPDTYQCMTPNHFLLTEGWLPAMLRFLLPPRRPMDNMPMGWHRPQEDEFGLCNQGVPSPYLYWMFPDRPCRYDHYLDLSELSDRELEKWKQAFLHFVKRLTLRDPRQLVLKSPTHTARVKTMLEIFPEAKFIHLVRNPQVMIPSTILTWRRLSEVLGLRVQIRRDLDDYVLENFRRMDESFQAERWRIPADQFYEARYEDLTANMVATVQDMYRHLSLGDFSNIQPHLERYVREHKGYRTNRFQTDPELQRKIATVCGDYSDRHGYVEQKLQATS